MIRIVEPFTFRSAVLRDELIDQGDVASFIEHQRALEAKAERIGIVKVAVPAPVKLDPKKDQRVSGKVFGLEALIISYSTPGEEWTKCVPVRFGGTLHQLKELSKGLSRAYLWTEAQACVFVLTGATPLVARVRCTLTHSNPSSTSRISLTVDPTVTPKELADHYRSIRKRFLGGRYRSPSPKHIPPSLAREVRPSPGPPRSRLGTRVVSHQTGTRETSYERSQETAGPP